MTFTAPRSRWVPLLSAAKEHGLQVVGVSFHVGSGCRDPTRYDLALRDAKELFQLAEKDYGFKMRILDIGGGFPGESHSLWNPETIIDNVVNEHLDDVPDDEDEEVEKKEGKTLEEVSDDDDKPTELNFFDDIASFVTPKIDEYFPPEDESVVVIGEPGRYLVAAAFTLVTSVTSVRGNAIDSSAVPEPIEDSVAAKGLDQLTRGEEQEIIDMQANPESAVIETIVEELQTYSKLYTCQNLTQQEIDVWQDKSDVGLLEAPDRMEILNAEKVHTAEGVTAGIVAECLDEEEGKDFTRSRSNSIARSRSNSLIKGTTVEEEFMNSVLTIAAAGEAAVSGVVIQAVADSTSYQDDYAYYVNDGVYGAFNNLMFDHASVRPRVLRNAPTHTNQVIYKEEEDTYALGTSSEPRVHVRDLFSSTIFGPTCDSIDVISRSTLLPKLEVGDWVYFQNMGAYTCAAASDFNGFTPTRKFYVCSVQPEDFESLD